MRFLFSAMAVILATMFSAPCWAWYDFKTACEIPKSTLISERNYAENAVFLRSTDGSRQCWVAYFTLKDGAFDQVTCKKVKCPIE